METNLEPPNPIPTTNSTLSPPHPHPLLDDDDDDESQYLEEAEEDFSNCSTPYVSAPSSPGRSTYSYPYPPLPPGGGFFYSAPTSPMHYVLAASPPPPRSSTTALLAPAISDASSNSSFEFEFSSRFDSPAPDTCSSADELFLNGQIRPMTIKQMVKVERECERLQENESSRDQFAVRSREWCRSRAQRSRRTRSLSPLRSSAPFDWLSGDDDLEHDHDTPRPKHKGGDTSVGKSTEHEREGEGCGGSINNINTPPGSGSSSRCSSAGRSSKRWVFLKDFLRSKSEGRSNNKFWHNISFSPVKEKKEKEKEKGKEKEREVNVKEGVKKGSGSGSGGARAAGKRRSAHEMHYAANRAQAEEMRKKTFLPYRQGLLGCLGFNSRSYGALNGFARALNPVSSR